MQENNNWVVKHNSTENNAVADDWENTLPLHKDYEQQAAILRFENSYGLQTEWYMYIDFDVKIEHDYPLYSDMFAYAVLLDKSKLPINLFNKDIDSKL